MRPAVCVVVPVYKAERTIDRCVASILSQKVPGGVACVLVDDGSPDRSGAMCDAWAAKDPRVQVVHKADGGRGTVVLATVRGDVHDIGKNIVKVVTESHGFTVVDLGKDVPCERVVAAVQKERPLAVGLSALMTTTVKSMEQTIAALRAAGCTAAVFVGGAVLNRETARAIGADHYTANASEFVRVLEELAAKK